MTELMRRMVAGIVIVALTLALFSSCWKKQTDEELINQRIEDFVSSYNAGDLNGVLDSFDAKTRNTYKATLGIADGLIAQKVDISLYSLFSLGIGLNSEDESISMTVLPITITDENSASVDAAMEYTVGPDSSENVVLTMVKEKNDWFIKNVEPK